MVDNVGPLMRSRAESAQSPIVFLFFVATDEAPADGLDSVPQRKQQVEAEQPGVLKDAVFHARRLESTSIHHKNMSNHRVLSSSNIIQPHA